MNHDDLVASWKEDSKIDDTKIQSEIVRTPFLHSKYLELYLYYKNKMLAAEKKYTDLVWKRKIYYRGEMTKDQLDELGWSQYHGLKQSNTEFNQTIEIDPLITPLRERIDYFKNLVQATEWILKQINQRPTSQTGTVLYI